MVAIVSGAGLGLLGTVGRGTGSAGVGQGADRVHVNGVTGNLVIQSEDERLRAIGLGTSWTRTYNSQGLLDDDNGDNWQLGVQQRVFGLSGELNTAGSSVKQLLGDGHIATFLYDGSLGVYVSTEGEGAHDTLSHGAGQWTWTEGDERSTQTFDDAGRLLRAADRFGNTLSYEYSGALLTRISDGSGQSTHLDYDAAGRNLTQIRVVSGGATQTRTRYSYDALDRLNQVQVDLSPEDNSVVDGNIFTTTYSYDGQSRRIASLGHSDGTSVSFTYEQGSDGQYRLSSYTEGAASLGRTTRFSYETAGGDQGASVHSRTHITDALGAVTIQRHDAAGRLVRVQGPLSSTEYVHDEDDNLTALIEDADGERRTTVFDYDGHGNRLLTRNAVGQVQMRTYNERNQLLNETHYRVADPDGAGSAQPGEPVTTRYVYGANDELRFAVSAEGRVTEFQYRADGLRTASITYTDGRYATTSLAPQISLSEAQLQSWVNAQVGTPRERVDFDYDFRGQLARETHYATTNASDVGEPQGASRIQYVYDQRGRLVQQLGALSSALIPNPADATLPHAITHVYDGRDRVIQSSRWIGGGEIQTTLTQYDDAGNRVLTTLANGLVSTATYDSSGALRSTVEASGTTLLAGVRFLHDAAGRVRQQINADGLTLHTLYDAAGRIAGSIDGDGSLTHFAYDELGQQTRTVRYADRLSPVALASLTQANGLPSAVTVATLVAGLPSTVGRASDQITRTVFDAGGRAVFTLGAEGVLTQYFYDAAGWLTDQIDYATPLSMAGSARVLRPEDVSVISDPKDRHSRTFYDCDGTVRARLDAAGYLIELVSDGAGRLREQIGYATATTPALRATGTLEQLRPAAAPADQYSYFFYDAQGRALATLDSGGYLSETVFDPAGRVQEQLRHDQVLNYSGGDLASLRAQLAPTSEVRRTRFEYDGADRLVRQTDYQGTVAEFGYDVVGQRVRATAAAGSSEARTVLERYDLLGRVVQRLSGEGSAQLTAGLSATQVDAIWERYGVRYQYSAGGWLLNATSRPNDSEVHTTRYFYDTDGVLRFEVNALGEVTESIYDAFGRLTERVAYTHRIATQGLNGGLVNDALTGRMAGVADAARDAHTYFSYTLTGQLKSTLSAGGALTTSSYNAFGELAARVEKLDATHSLRTEFTYDARGLLTREQVDPLGLNLQSHHQYDAFGRLTVSTNPAGHTTRLDYDGLGRAIATEDALGARRITTYDAFSRTLTSTNALGAITRCHYDAAARTTTLTTPEGVTVTTTVNRHGQTSSVAAAGNLTTYEYDYDGRLQRSADALGTLEEHDYDRAGRALTTRDARGVESRFTYDAASRVLTQTVEVDGIAQLLRYEYDGQGRVTQVTQPDGRVTATSYDVDGRITQLAVDPSGLNLRTLYQYDAGGRGIVTIEGAGSEQPRITRYSFDVLGRRAEEVLDPGPGKLNCTRAFRYDADSNLTRVIDALGRSTWTVFDAAGRAIQTIDASGAVIETRYDAEGRIVASLQYARRVNTAGFGDVVARATPSTSTEDRLTQFVYDADARQRFLIDGSGAVTERSFDERGNIIRTRAYARPIALAQYASIDAVHAALSAAGNDPNTPATNDRLAWTAYDSRGESAFTVDSAGAVARLERDAAGNVTRTIAFATLRATTLPMDLASLRSWATPAGIANHSDNRIERFWYDAAGRQVLHHDAEGYLEQTVYRDAERRTSTIRYGERVSLPAGATLAQVRAHSVVAGFNPARDRVSTVVHDAAGRVVERYDALTLDTNTAVERYAYDAVGNRITLADPRGNITHFVFDAAGREITVTDPLDGIARKTYDGLGQLVKLTDPRGHSGYRYYNALGQVAIQIDPNGYVTQLDYDTLGNVTAEKVFANALGGTYDEATTITDILGRLSLDATRDRQLTRSFDALGRVQTVTYHNSSASCTEEFRYDAFGQTVELKDKNGAVTNYAYNARGEQVSVLGPAVEVVTAVFPTPSTQLLRLETVTQYDAFGQRVLQIEAAGTSARRETRFFYDHLGHQVRVLGPAFEVYDRASNTSTQRTPETLSTYDAAGNLIKVVGPNAGVTLNYYDTRNLLVATVGPDSVLSVFEYDAVGNRTLERIHGTPLTGSLDPSIRPTPIDDDDYRELRHEFDANNRRIKTETRAETLYSIALADRTGDGYYTDSVVTLASYDANGNPVAITDGNGGMTRSFYDAVGNKVLEVDAAGYVTYRHYNGQGQVILETQFAGQLTPALCDALTPAGSVAGVLAALPSSGEDRSTAFAYDQLGRKVEESRLGVTYTVIDPASGRPTFVTAAVMTSFKYDGNGNVIEQTLADGGRIDYTYDALNRISARLDPQFQAFIGQGQPLAALRSQQLFKYDAHGNEAQQISLGSTPAENREVLQRFDSAGNLRERTEPGGAGFTYDYDLSGNTVRTTRAVRDVNGTLHQYRTYATFDAVDREISRQDIADQGTAAQVVRETQDTQYNGYGDVVAKGVNGQYQEIQRYDRLGRLFATREKGAPTLFIYDANGNAVLKIRGIASDVTQVMEGGVMRAVRGPADAQAFSPEHEQFTTSFYDERNLLVALAEAPMTFGSLLAAQPVLEGSRRDAPEALRAARDSLPTALTLRNPTNATLAADNSREFNASADVPVKGFGAPSTSNTSSALDARHSSPPNFGVLAAGPPVLTEPVVTLVSDTENSDRTVRTVVEDITRTLTTTTVEAKDLNGDGVFESVVKTVKTENPVTRRTTTFTRSRTETVAQNRESLSGEATVTVKEDTKTTGTVNVYEERTTRTILGSTVTEYTYPGAATGVLNLLPVVPLTINIDYNRSGLSFDPELDEIVEIVVSVSSPAIAGLGNDPVIVEVYGPAGQLRRQTSTTGGAAFATSFPGTHGDAVSISVTKGGSLLFYSSYATADETVNLGPFVSLKELPPSAVGARLSLLSEDGSVAATLSNFSTVTSGSTRELVFSESPAGAFYFNRRYEYTLLDSQGGIVNRVQGRLGSTARSPEVTTRRSSFTREVTRNTLNQNGSLDQSASVTADPKQANYLLNLVRSITQGVEHDSIIKREQTYNAFQEVVTQKDGRGFVTELFYDQQGNLARQVQPETTIYPEVGAAFRGRPVTQYLFNQLSEQVGTQDANSAAFSAAAPYYSTRVLVNGRIAREFDAHGNLTQHFYDLHGQERLERDALNQDTEYSYDLAGQLLRQERFNANGTLHSADSFQYDVAGNRIGRTNALGDTETYLYDDQGRITEYRSFAGLMTTYTYAYQAGIGGVGGHEKVTTTAAISGQDTQIERTDVFGNLHYSQDLGGHEFTYEYDAAGLLRRQSGTTAALGRNAQDIRYEYYLNGLIRSINDLGISSYSNFAYDENGNRTEEIYSEVAITAGLQDVHPYQVAHATYDELNRQSKIADAGRFEVEYGYDANGNRRFVASDYFDLLTNNVQHQQFYYKYDKLGQFTVTLGQRDTAGQIVSGTTGYAIEYDALGRRISATSRLLDKSTNQQRYAREEYQYDRIGTVNRVEIRNESGALLARSDRRNSAVGSLLEQTETKIEQGFETETRQVAYTYDRDQRVQTEITTSERNLDRRDRTEYTYDGDGILTSTFATTINRDGNVVDSADRVTTTYLYEKWSSYKQSSVNVVVGDRNMRNWRSGTSTYSYDSNGHTKTLHDAQAARTIEYVNNQSGQVLKRYQIDREANGSDAPAVIRNFYYLNGRGIGDTGNDLVESRVDYAQQLAEQEKRDKRGRTSPLNPQLSQRILPVTSSDFDANYQPLNDGFPAKVAGTHIVQANETLQSIALSIYGDSSLWYLIADANGLTGNDQLVSGLRLTTPNVIANTHNRADTYRPYDVEAALGNTKPTLSPPPPPPQGKKGCGGVGTVLVFAVAIIAGTLTAGVAAQAVAGLFSSGFAAGVAGAVAAGVGYSLASQAVLLAAGFQNKFSFKQVGRDTISELVSFGLDKLAKLAETNKKLEFIKKLKTFGEFAHDGLRGAVANVLTQGIATTVGLQRSFDWREVGIAGAASATGGLFRREAVAFTRLTGRRADLVGNIAAGIGGSLVRKAAGEEVNSQTLLQDLGRSLGSAAAGYLTDSLGRTGEAAPTAADTAAQETGEGTTTGSDFATNTMASRVAAGAAVAEESATTLSGISAGEGIIQEVVVTGRRFTYAQNLEYDLLRSPFYFIRADGFRGSGNTDPDDNRVSRLAEVNVANNIRKDYQDEQDFKFAARNYGLFIDTVSPFAQGKRFLLDVANTGIHLGGGFAYAGLYETSPELASAGKEYIEGLRIDYDSPFNEAMGVGLADEFAVVRGGSVDLIGEPGTTLLGEGLHYLLDVAVLTGTHIGGRNTGFAHSLEETGLVASQRATSVFQKFDDVAAAARQDPTEPALAGTALGSFRYGTGIRRGEPGSLSEIDRFAIDQKPIDGFTIQPCAISCGPATGVELLQDIGIAKSVEAVAKEARLGPTLGGVTTDNLTEALNTLSRPGIFRGGNIDAGKIPDLLKGNRRFITLLDPQGRGGGHFVVVNGLDDAGLVKIQDPRGLGYKLTQDNFKKIASDSGNYIEVIFRVRSRR